MSAARAIDGQAQRGNSAEGAGLVSYKTKLQEAFVSFSPSVVAERRIKRLKKSVWASGHLHGIADSGFRAPRVWFVTLTYRGVADWAANHVRDAVQSFRNWCRDRNVACRYTWVAEIQPKRLAQTGHSVVHYHLLAWLPADLRMPKWDRRTVTTRGRRIACWWPHGMTNTQVAKAGVGYLMKYLSKLGEFTRFPKGLRLYGIGGLNEQGRAVRSWLNLPEWVKCSHGVGEIARRPRCFLVRASGEILDPAYQVRRVPHGIELHALRAIPERFHSGPYSAFPQVTA